MQNRTAGFVVDLLRQETGAKGTVVFYLSLLFIKNFVFVTFILSFNTYLQLELF